MPPKSFFRKTGLQSEYFYEIAPSPIFRAKRAMWLNSNWKLRSLLPKMPLKSFFWKIRFRSELFYEIAPYLFSRPNGLCGSFRGKNSALFCLKRPQNHFFEKHVSSLNFFSKPPPHPFSGPNRCLKRPRNRFYEKYVSSPNIFAKPPLTYFRGQIDYVACFEVKTLIAFA